MPTRHARISMSRRLGGFLLPFIALLLAACSAPGLGRAPTGAPPISAGTLLPTTQVALPAAPANATATPEPEPGAPAGRILIPRLNIDLPVQEVTWHVEAVDGQPLGMWDTVEDAAGHHLGTAPLGASGNCVLSGHSGSEQGQVFYGLWDLEPGDEINVLDAQGVSHSYSVDSVTTVAELGEDLARRYSNAAVMAPTEDTRLTLITCWPEWAYTHRVIVVALAKE